MSFGDVVFATFLMALVVMFAAIVTRHWGLALAHLWIAYVCCWVLGPDNLVGAAVVSFMVLMATLAYIDWRRLNARPAGLIDIRPMSRRSRRRLERLLIAEFERSEHERWKRERGKNPEGPDHG